MLALPKKFVESDFVTQQRLKYEASTKRQKIVNAIAYGTGAVVGASVVVGVFVVGSKILDKNDD